MHIQLNMNASSVQYHLGNGKISNLFFMVTPDVFNTLSATPLVPPPNTRQDHINPTGRTGPQIADIRDSHAWKTRVYKLFGSTDKVIKKLILGAAVNIFVHAFCNRHIV